MKKVENSEKVVKTHRPEVPVNSDLLDALKALRKGIASKKSVPAYVIFTDATLIDMCKKCLKFRVWAEQSLKNSENNFLKKSQNSDNFIYC